MPEYLQGRVLLAAQMPRLQEQTFFQPHNVRKALLNQELRFKDLRSSRFEDLKGTERGPIFDVPIKKSEMEPSNLRCLSDEGGGRQLGRRLNQQQRFVIFISPGSYDC